MVSFSDYHALESAITQLALQYIVSQLPRTHSSGCASL